MKKILLVGLMFVISNTVQAQTTDSVKTDTVTIIDPVKLQTDSLLQELESYNKIKLTEIYLNEVIRVTNILPICAFDTVSNNVPKSDYTDNKFKRTEKKVNRFTDVLMKEYREIIPYADKKELIRSIVYLKSIK
jgi:hypothetical protein